MKYKLIVFSGFTLIIVIAIIGFTFGRKPQVGTGAIIEFWGTDSPDVWTPIITAYQTINPTITVKYTQKNQDTYEKELVNTLASGMGPDIAFIENTWLNKHLDKFSPAPVSAISEKVFKDTFVDITAQDLIRSKNIYALPFYVDTIGLYYNKSLFNNANIINPPKTWNEFGDYAKKLTTKDKKSGDIIRSGVALGSAVNVNYSSDILSLLMIQTGTVMIEKDGSRAGFDKSVSLNDKPYSPGVSSLDFYVGFANISKPVYSWNSRMPNSLLAFKQGKTAMYFGYAKDLIDIMGSGVNFGVSNVPQVKDSKTDDTYLDINFGSYLAGAVTQKSLNKAEAWSFLVFATSKNAAGTYLNQTFLPPARKDLIEFTKTNDSLNVFSNQSLTASGWAQPDDVEIKKIFNRMIDSVSLGQSVSSEAIKNAAIEVTNLLK